MTSSRFPRRRARSAAAIAVLVLVSASVAATVKAASATPAARALAAGSGRTHALPSPQTPPEPVSRLGYKLVFSDDFNTFDSSVWDKHIWYGRGTPDTVFAKNGVLHVESLRADGWGSANAETNREHAWTYGYFEARLKWTGSPGAWPAFWLISEAQRDGKTNAHLLTSEVDIQEGDGTDPDGYNTALHRNSSMKFGVSDKTAPRVHWHPELNLGDLANTWHTYALLWTPTKVSWYLDGNLIATAPTFPDSTDQPMFIVLTMGNGGALSGASKPPASGPGLLQTEVNWVRVWQRPA